MFNFREELAKYRESLAVENLSEGVSGDEVRDILDIAKQLVGQRPSRTAPKKTTPKTDRPIVSAGGKTE